MFDSRRKFFQAGTLVALSAAIPASVFGQNPKDRDGNPLEQQADPLAQYSRGAFASYLNSIFQLYTGYSVVEVALMEVTDLLSPTVTAANGRECFSLLFRGGSVALPQNTYLLTHPSLGRFQMFLVPGGPDDVGAQSFVAIINRVSYSDALNSVPSRLSKPSDRTKPEDPVATPKTTAPAHTKPVRTTSPTGKPKALRKRKPWLRSGENEDFEGGIDQ